MIKEYRKQTGVWNVVIPRESKTVQCEKNIPICTQMAHST